MCSNYSQLIINSDYDFLGTATGHSTYGLANDILFDDFHCTGMQYTFH